MVQTGSRVNTATAMQRPCPYLGAAALSLVTTPVLFAVSLFLGVAVGVFGALGGAFSASDQGVARGFHMLFLGLALLAGPALYLLLAVVR